MEGESAARFDEADINEYVKVKGLIYNPLHDKGFPSIGCAPCTRAIEAGADPRSGRWWWKIRIHVSVDCSRVVA